MSEWRGACWAGRRCCPRQPPLPHRPCLPSPALSYGCIRQDPPSSALIWHSPSPAALSGLPLLTHQGARSTGGGVGAEAVHVWGSWVNTQKPGTLPASSRGGTALWSPALYPPPSPHSHSSVSHMPHASAPSRITQQSLHHADVHLHTAHLQYLQQRSSPPHLASFLYSSPYLHSNRFITLMSAITLQEHPGSTTSHPPPPPASPPPLSSQQPLYRFDVCHHTAGAPRVDHCH